MFVNLFIICVVLLPTPEDSEFVPDDNAGNNTLFITCITPLEANISGWTTLAVLSLFWLDTVIPFELFTIISWPFSKVRSFVSPSGICEDLISPLTICNWSILVRVS